MKQILIIPLALALAGALGYGAVRAIHWNPFAREMMLAAIPSLLSGILAIVPALRQRMYGQAAVVQAAFYGMILHLGTTLVVGLFVFFAAGIKGPATQPYALWVAWFFWVSLAAVSSSLIRLVRSTPISPAGTNR